MHEALSTSQVAALPSNVREHWEALKGRMTPEGLLGLPRHLDARRLEFAIPDGAFEQEAMYDRILIWQVPERKSETFEEGGKILMTENTKAANLYRAPIGIIVSAGLKALDSLVSNGAQLGDKVLFVKSAPYFVRCDTVAGKDYNLVVLTDGEIVSNFDLAKRIKERRLFKVQNPTEPNRVEHVFKGEDGKWLMPQTAWREES